MRIYTSHLKAGRSPVMVREGFSLWAAIFGWIWLLLQGAWVAAALLLAASLIIGRGGVWLGSPMLPLLGLCVLQGMFGRDLVRWDLARRGYTPGPPVAADNVDGALARLLTERIDITAALGAAR